ncbi:MULTISPECIES: hypothetical protein [unclassified Corallococcus]|uniref:hypothetical protein n=1 Tax=unclassified Corallococcus TaxID=2685029 RepID=UPI001A8F347B|nr:MULTISPECIES: hypothetical protein [unclassified Corallococcus]MBN9685166.1 hypothetical protein [Corallococcus sp. NCSPR001]WAS83376.1 hypothetical protein O0N60_29185 [Corallococcus sp. NCRR]
MKTLLVVLWLAWFQAVTWAALVFLRLLLWTSGIPAEVGRRIAIALVTLGAGVLVAVVLATTDALEEQARALLAWRAARRHQRAQPREVDGG